MMKTKLYTAEATSIGGRNGHGETSDGSLKLDLAVPKEMGGTGKVGVNPEQLFAIGYSACFGGAIEYVAHQHKKTLKDIQVTARVSIGPRDKGGFELGVELDVRLAGVSHAEAEALVAEAHNQVCPYSNATRGNVDVKVTVLD
jgi:Ohr subfamily peroxiredoxin